MAPKIEGKRPGDVLLWEEDDHFSREKVTITGGDYEVGTVLGQITASKKYTIHAPGASDGSETVKAVLIEAAEASETDVEALIVARHARVKRHGLVFDASIDTEAERQTAVDGLKTLGILTDV